MSTEKNILHTLEEGVMLTGLVAGVGWIGQKAFGESLSPNPSKSVMNYIKTTANMTGCMVLRDWMKKHKYWPDILKMASRKELWVDDYNIINHTLESIYTIQGAKGRQGDKGDTGAQGPAGTFTTPTADVSFGNHKITNLGNPRDGTEAVNKNYADGKYTNIITPVFLSRAFNITHEPASGTVFNYSNHTPGTRYFLIIVHYLLKLLKSPTDAQSCGGSASASPITHPTIVLQHAGAGFRIDFNSNNYKITPLLKSGVIMSELRVEYMIGFRC